MSFPHVILAKCWLQLKYDVPRIPLKYFPPPSQFSLPKILLFWLVSHPVPGVNTVLKIEDKMEEEYPELLSRVSGYEALVGEAPALLWPLTPPPGQSIYSFILTSNPFDFSFLNPTPSGSILNLFHLGATIFCQHTYSTWVCQFFANIRFILYFLILALIVKVSLAIFCQTREE